MTLFVAHYGSDTFFALDDDAYIFDDTELASVSDDTYRSELAEGLEQGAVREVCDEIGVYVTEGLRVKISEAIQGAERGTGD